jgi:uncharacterized protein with PIN domain
MSTIKREDVVGYYVDDRTLCPECYNALGNSDESSLTEDDILTQKEAEASDDLIFCDECKQKIY